METLEAKIVQLSQQLENAMGYSNQELLQAKDQWISKAVKGIDLSFIPQVINGILQFREFCHCRFCRLFCSFFPLKGQQTFREHHIYFCS